MSDVGEEEETRSPLAYRSLSYSVGSYLGVPYFNVIYKFRGAIN